MDEIRPSRMPCTQPLSLHRFPSLPPSLPLRFLTIEKKTNELTGLALGDLGDQSVDLIEALEIGWERDALARSELGQLLSDLVTDIGRAGRDVDVGAVDDESVGDHQADSIIQVVRELVRRVASVCATDNGKKPYPRLPPVTRTTLSLTSKREDACMDDIVRKVKRELNGRGVVAELGEECGVE